MKHQDSGHHTETFNLTFKEETKMEENLYYEDEEENRHFKRYRRMSKESRHDFDDRESSSGSADSFDAIWEGRN
jgi:hypothetical protein